jgi:hypothetical protein
MMQFPIFKLENDHTKALIDAKSGEFALQLTDDSDLIQGHDIVLNRIAGIGFDEPKIELIFTNPPIPIAPQIEFKTVILIQK